MVLTDSQKTEFMRMMSAHLAQTAPIDLVKSEFKDDMAAIIDAEITNLVADLKALFGTKLQLKLSDADIETALFFVLEQRRINKKV